MEIIINQLIVLNILHDGDSLAAARSDLGVLRTLRARPGRRCQRAGSLVTDTM
jgi:hypothetical protein